MVKFGFGLPFARRMYWADWGNHPKIETAAMDGTMRETLVEENIQWPTGKSSTHGSWRGTRLLEVMKESRK